MKTSKNLVIAALAVWATTTSVVAWKFYWKAALLEAAAVGGDDATALRQQLAEAEKRRRVLEAREASRAEAKDDRAAGAVAERGAGETPAAGGRGRGRGGPPSAEMQAAMERPEVQRLQALQQKAALDGRYGALFKTLNLGDEKLATFKTLLAEKEATMMDTMRAAREQGLDPRSDPEGFKKLVAATQAETDNAIRAAIGETAFAQYEQYQATQPQRALVNQLQQSLSYTNAPLTSAQADQMVQVLAVTTTATAGASGSGTSGTPGAGAPPEGMGMGGRGSPMGGGGPGGGTSAVLITAATVTAAQTVLTTTQVQALQDLQALQVAQQQAQAILRAAGAGGPPAGGGRATGGG